jgi:hypothetical protein
MEEIYSGDAGRDRKRSYADDVEDDTASVKRCALPLDLPSVLQPEFQVVGQFQASSFYFLAGSSTCFFFISRTEPWYGVLNVIDMAFYDFTRSQHPIWSAGLPSGKDITDVRFGTGGSPLVLTTVHGTVITVAFCFGACAEGVFEETLWPDNPEMAEGLRTPLHMTVKTGALAIPPTGPPVIINHDTPYEDAYVTRAAVRDDCYRVTTIAPIKTVADARLLLSFVHLPQEETVTPRLVRWRLLPDRQKYKGVVTRQELTGPAFEQLYAQGIGDIALVSGGFVVVLGPQLAWRLYMGDVNPIPLPIRLPLSPWTVTLSPAYIAYVPLYRCWLDAVSAGLRSLHTRPREEVVAYGEQLRTQHPADYIALETQRVANMERRPLVDTEPLWLEFLYGPDPDDLPLRDGCYFFLKALHATCPAPMVGPANILIEATETAFPISPTVVHPSCPWDGIDICNQEIVLRSPVYASMILDRHDASETWHSCLSPQTVHPLEIEHTTVTTEGTCVSLSYAVDLVHRVLLPRVLLYQPQSQVDSLTWPLEAVLPMPTVPLEPLDDNASTEAHGYMRLHNAKIWTATVGRQIFVTVTNLEDTVLVLVAGCPPPAAL